MGMIMKDGVPYGGVYPIDDVPTQGSDNTVKSGGVFSSLSNKVDKVDGKGLSTNDYDNTEKDQNEANAKAIEAIVNVNGCCNILDNNQPSEAKTNITWTVNTDKTVTVSSGGQSVSGLEHHEINHSFTILPGTYKLSGGVDSNNYIELLETNYYSTGIIDTGNGYEFTVSVAHTYIVLLRSGNGVVNAEFKPMIHDARLKPTGYVPYAMTNRELTERVDRGSVSVVADGVKTYRELLNQLYSIIDSSRITHLSVFSIGNNSFYPLCEISSQRCCFGGIIEIDNAKINMVYVNLNATTSLVMTTEDLTKTNISFTAPSVNTSFILYY